jgi:hypothetical protein
MSLYSFLKSVEEENRYQHASSGRFTSCAVWICMWLLCAMVSCFVPVFCSAVQFAESVIKYCKQVTVLSHYVRCMHCWSSFMYVTFQCIRMERYWMSHNTADSWIRQKHVWSAVKCCETLQQGRFFHEVRFLHFGDSKSECVKNVTNCRKDELSDL